MKNIDASKASLDELNAFYNANSGSTVKQTFNTIEKAREKVIELQSALAELGSGTSKGKSKKSGAKPAKGAAKKDGKKEAKPAKGAAKEKPEKKEGASARGRSSSFATQTISRAINKETGKPFENPRREGTHGFKSFNLVPAKGGITYEDYIKAGGRPNDLRWDVDRGTLIVK